MFHQDKKIVQGLVDFVPLTLMTDECTCIGLVLKDAGDHSGVPDVFLADVVVGLRLPFLN